MDKGVAPMGAATSLPATWNPLRHLWRSVRNRMAAQITQMLHEEGTLRQRAPKAVQLDPSVAHPAADAGQQLQLALAQLRDEFNARLEVLEERAWWVAPARPSLSPEEPFMAYSTCSASDLTHPRYFELCRLLHETPRWHRKQWEWVFVLHHLLKSGVVKPGNSGVGFGVGREMLPAVFASFGASVIATDAPDDVMGWEETNEHSSSREQLRAPWIVSDADFDRLVSHRAADMNAIPDSLRDYDFTWSSCCYEHLGSIQAGSDFVVNSVERLRPGGIAVHTTEFNVCSNDKTLVDGPTVLFRRQDFEALIDRLRGLGYDAQPFTVSPNLHTADSHVDLPPYALPHLKLEIGGYVTTSAGVVVRRPY